MQAQLSRADRLAALGELSAGIAHEIKNPLTSLKGFTQLLPSRFHDESFREKFVRVMTNEVNRLNSIVERLLTFAKPRVSSVREVDVEKILAYTIELLEYEARKSGVVLNKVFRDVGKVSGDASKIEQVFLNILLNGIQAMPDGGEIDIETGRQLKKITESVYEHFIVILITDYGVGIPMKDMENLFNPFFTTKDKGTGLGLSIAYRIVEEHSGLLEVESKKGKGTKFTIFLPKLRREA